MAEFRDEIIGGDGKRRYNLIRSDGSVMAQGIEFAKAYTPEQEGSPFGATEVNEIYNAMRRLQSVAVTATLTASGWSGTGPYTQTVSVEGVQATTGGVTIAIAPTSTDEQRIQVSANGVWCSSKSDGALTFIAQSVPSENIPLIILVSGGDSAIINALPRTAEYAQTSVTELITATQTWTPPAGLVDRQVDVRLFGGGGRSTTGGGGGGHMAHAIVTLDNLDPITVTIGAAATSSTTAGGVTSFGSYLSANGGSKSDGGTGGGGKSGNAGNGSYGGGGGGAVGSANDGGTAQFYKAGNGGGYGGGGGGGGRWVYDNTVVSPVEEIPGGTGGVSSGGNGGFGGGGYSRRTDSANGGNGVNTYNMGLEFEGSGTYGARGSVYYTTSGTTVYYYSGGGGGGGYGGNGGKGGDGEQGCGGGGGGYGADGGNGASKVSRNGGYGGGGGGYGGRGGHYNEGGFGGGYGLDNYGRGWGTSSYPGKSGIAILKYRKWEIVNA